MKLVVLLVFLLFSFGHSYTNFIHLLGYALNAGILTTYNTTNVNGCGTECALTTNCTAFQIIHATGECNLLTMLRNYYFDSSQCEYYLKRSPGVTVTNRTLTSDMDVVFQNAVYDSQGPCPLGWTILTNVCYLNVPKNTCYEFAPFLEPRYDFACMIPLMIVDYNCPESTYKLGNYTDGHFCIKVIPKWSDDAVLGNMKPYDFANQYCYNQTGGYLASIHSKAENNDINTIQQNLEETNPGVMIGLIANSSSLANTDDMYWLDGTGISYTNYAGNSKSDVFTYTLMTLNGQWKITMDSTVAKTLFKYIACKQNAVATMTKKH
uniref:C-type lectin domain-containing protein n=1 Tax=Panagrellus redivivus TaxID=6233 RepID=A0A7E4VF10_PANRE